MSALREQIRSGSAAQVVREPVCLPKCGAAVQVRALMLGERLRINGLGGKERVTTTIALATEDPGTNKLLWNPNDLNDMTEIEGLHGDDGAVLIETINRISGIGEDSRKQGKDSSAENENSPSSSPSATESPLTNSENESAPLTSPT